jgi:hypothetical protein
MWRWRTELAEETGLALVETFGVIRLCKLKVLVIQVVTKLVEECPKEGLEFDDLCPLGCSHPYRDLMPASLVRLVEPMELAGRPGRPAFEDFDAYAAYTEGLGQAIHETLGLPLCRESASAGKRFFEKLHGFMQPGDARYFDFFDLITCAIDSLLTRAQLSVIGKGHKNSKQ